MPKRISGCEASAVHFGAAKATEVGVLARTKSRVVTPPGSGTVGVTVTTPEGSTVEHEEDEFTYH